MKKLVLLIFCLYASSCFAQPGYINLVAGIWPCAGEGFSGDGGPSTAALMQNPSGVSIDGSGNIYISDNYNARIRKVDHVTKIISTVAGGGVDTADGIPATNAIINLGDAAGVTTDFLGNFYVIDGNKVRRVDATTGIITTIVGGGSSGLGDGGPATAATLNGPQQVCLDNYGNIYIGDDGNARVRKINPLGIISTYAGTTVGFSGDGGPATAAQLNSASGVFMDPYGNLFVADRYSNRVRKIDALGIITTVAGQDSIGFSGDGGPATNAKFNSPSTVCVDFFGNLYIADYNNSVVRMVNPLGIISTYAGENTVGGGWSSIDCPATDASFDYVNGIGIDQLGNVYIADVHNEEVYEVYSSYSPTITPDSFSVMVCNSCNGLVFDVQTNNFSTSQHIVTLFGNGTELDTALTNCGIRGATHFFENYLTGTYTIKHILFDGTLPIDSISYTHSFRACQDYQVNLYYDANGNCIRDSGDITMLLPATFEVDSNGVPVDTLSAASGFVYTAYGVSGDIYSFKVIESPSGFYVSCPLTGIVFDTVNPAQPLTTVINMGFNCTTVTAFDLSIHSVVPVTGVNDEWGDIYINNYDCLLEDATVSVTYSPKYAGTPNQIYPPAASVTGNIITWNIGGLSSALSVPYSLHYSLWWDGTTPLTIGDTVQSHFIISPMVGDADTLNNRQFILDTVRAGCDPNRMWVTPSCVNLPDSPVVLQYTINFENTGNDTAHNIYVLDTLPANVDFESVKILFSSNEMYAHKLTDDSGRRILKFDFPGINLLDSSHHAYCDGNVAFQVKALAGIPSGASMTNRAGIYFDVNPVVMTNSITTNFGGCMPTGEKNIHSTLTPRLYPNPATQTLFIENSGVAYTTAIITDILGQQIMDISLTSITTSVDVSTFRGGMYFVLFSGSSGNIVERFVK